MYEVVTDHQVVAFGADRMDLFECATGTAIASAVRVGDGWRVHVWAEEGIEPVDAESRRDAVTAMTEQVLAVLPGTGYSTTVPHGLMDAP